MLNSYRSDSIGCSLTFWFMASLCSLNSILKEQCFGCYDQEKATKRATEKAEKATERARKKTAAQAALTVTNLPYCPGCTVLLK